MERSSTSGCSVPILSRSWETRAAQPSGRHFEPKGGECALAALLLCHKLQISAVSAAPRPLMSVLLRARTKDLVGDLLLLIRHGVVELLESRHELLQTLGMLVRDL